jgi:hypothetical protein
MRRQAQPAVAIARYAAPAYAVGLIFEEREHRQFSFIPVAFTTLSHFAMSSRAENPRTRRGSRST